MDGETWWLVGSGVICGHDHVDGWLQKRQGDGVKLKLCWISGGVTVGIDIFVVFRKIFLLYIF